MSTVNVINAYLTKDPIFYPGETPEKHHCVMTVLENRGKNKAGVQQLTAIDVSIWSKGAKNAACHLHKGRCISFSGELRSFNKNLGFKLPSGKDAIFTRMEVRIPYFHFGPETNKEALERYKIILKECEDKGIKLTPEILNDKKRSATVDYNPALVAATGKYGHARVWNKATNAWMKPGDAGLPLPVATTTPVTGTPMSDESINALEKRIIAMKATQAAQMAAGEEVAQDPFMV